MYIYLSMYCSIYLQALASTSATPGHTSRFHFFSVNAARGDLPAFRLVDVPGLGFAQAAAGAQDSWRALLERYAGVRSSLSAVFHLVDSRHQVTPTDKQVRLFVTDGMMMMIVVVVIYWYMYISY